VIEDSWRTTARALSGNGDHIPYDQDSVEGRLDARSFQMIRWADPNDRQAAQ